MGRPIVLGEIEGLLELAIARIDRTTFFTTKNYGAEKMAREYINRVSSTVVSMIKYSDPLTNEVQDKYATFNRRLDGFLNLLGLFGEPCDACMKLSSENKLLNEILAGIQPTQDDYINRFLAIEMAFVLEKRTLMGGSFDALKSRILDERVDCKAYIALCKHYCKTLMAQVTNTRFPASIRAAYLKEITEDWGFLKEKRLAWTEKLEKDLQDAQRISSEKEYFSGGLSFLEYLLDDIFMSMNDPLPNAPACLDETFRAGLPLFLRKYQGEFVARHVEIAHQALTQLNSEELAPEWALSAWEKTELLRQRIRYLYQPLQLSQTPFPMFVC